MKKILKIVVAARALRLRGDDHHASAFGGGFVAEIETQSRAGIADRGHCPGRRYFSPKEDAKGPPPLEGEQASYQEIVEARAVKFATWNCGNSNCEIISLKCNRKKAN